MFVGQCTFRVVIKINPFFNFLNDIESAVWFITVRNNIYNESNKSYKKMQKSLRIPQIFQVSETWKVSIPGIVFFFLNTY